MTITVSVALVAALLGPLLTYLVAMRKLSGKIDTSDAASLWEESRDMRKDYLARIQQLNERIVALEGRNDRLYAENEALRHTVDQHERTIGELRQENAALKRRVKELEGKHE